MWLDHLAAIMELDECARAGEPKVVFSMMGRPDDVGDSAGGRVFHWPGARGRNNGWYCYDHKTLRIWCHANMPDVVCEVNNDAGDVIGIINMWNSLQPIYQRSTNLGGLPFHAALVELDGRGILLAAPGDTGKSTCCRRLPDYWRALCDDETLVVSGKEKRYRAHPFPTWSDHLYGSSEKTWNVQYSVPVAAMFFLEQAEADEAVPVGQGEAAVLMSDSASQICQRFWRRMDIKDERSFRVEIFHNACEMAKRIPAFRLRVSLHGRFWEEIEKALERVCLVDMRISMPTSVVFR